MTEHTTFSTLGMSPRVLQAVSTAGYTNPTPIQAQAIPVALTGKDIIGIAQTGTGKTLAFGIPLIEHLLTNPHAQSLIVVPTRELALQVEESLSRVGRALGMHAVSLIGGASLGDQISRLRSVPQIIIGTPGRIIDHLERRSLTLNRVTVVVLDEADRMLDMGFAQQMRQILGALPAQRQTMLFSATMPGDIVRIAERYMRLPLRVEIAPAGTTADRVTQELFIIAKQQKGQLLEKLLTEYTGTILVFSRTKHGAKKVCRAVNAMGHQAAEIHSNRSLAQRKQALAGFKNGTYRVLVATDIAARGIDVTGIEVVINYDVPENPEDYVHRIGRTGRAGQSGHAISFVEHEQKHKIRAIERLVRASLAITPLPQLPPARPQPAFTPRPPMQHAHSAWNRNRNRHHRPNRNFSERQTTF